MDVSGSGRGLFGIYNLSEPLTGCNVTNKKISLEDCSRRGRTIPDYSVRCPILELSGELNGS